MITVRGKNIFVGIVGEAVMSGNRFKKSSTIQIMRGLAIIMVVLQHSLGRFSTTKLEYAVVYGLNHVDVAVFFLISGYLFEKGCERYKAKGTKDFLYGKFKSLMIPYFFWFTLIALLINCVIIIAPSVASKLEGNITSWTIKEFFINMFTYNDYYIQHLWFAYVIYVFIAINYFLGKKAVGRCFVVTATVLCAVFYSMHMNYLLDKLSLHFMQFVFGRLIALHLSKIKKYAKGIIISLCIVLFCFYLEAETKSGFTYLYVGNQVYAISGVCVIYGFSRLILQTKFRNMLMLLGDYSFEIYLMHTPYVSLLIPVILGGFSCNKYVSVFITSCLCVVLPIFVTKVLQSTYIGKVILGRNTNRIKTLNI